MQRPRVDLVRLVREMVDDRTRLFDGVGLKLELQAPETPLWVEGDGARLAQALGNILDNAAKFTPAGGLVKVRMHRNPGDNAEIRISDTGSGIHREQLEVLAHILSQSGRPPESRQGRTGLGLSIAKELVDLHGGSIRARSEGPGRGTQITVFLPLQPELPPLSKGLPASGLLPKPLRILIIEDNRDSAESLRRMLHIYGADVVTVHNGTQGVETARASRWDVILCDIGLPGMDGFAVAEALRRDPKTANVRMIAMTGYGQKADRLRALSAGFDVHLVKPVAPSELLRQLAEAAG